MAGTSPNPLRTDEDAGRFVERMSEEERVLVQRALSQRITISAKTKDLDDIKNPFQQQLMELQIKTEQQKLEYEQRFNGLAEMVQKLAAVAQPSQGAPTCLTYHHEPTAVISIPSPPAPSLPSVGHKSDFITRLELLHQTSTFFKNDSRKISHALCLIEDSFIDCVRPYLPFTDSSPSWLKNWDEFTQKWFTYKTGY